MISSQFHRCWTICFQSDRRKEMENNKHCSRSNNNNKIIIKSDMSHVCHSNNSLHLCKWSGCVLFVSIAFALSFLMILIAHTLHSKPSSIWLCIVTVAPNQTVTSQHNCDLLLIPRFTFHSFRCSQIANARTLNKLF